MGLPAVHKCQLGMVVPFLVHQWMMCPGWGCKVEGRDSAVRDRWEAVWDNWLSVQDSWWGWTVGW